MKSHSLFSSVLHSLADRIDEGNCTERDWQEAQYLMEHMRRVPERDTTLKQDVLDLKSSFGYLFKKVQSLENKKNIDGLQASEMFK